MPIRPHGCLYELAEMILGFMRSDPGFPIVCLYILSAAIPVTLGAGAQGVQDPPLGGQLTGPSAGGRLVVCAAS